MSYGDEHYGQWMYDRKESHPDETLKDADAAYNVEQEAEKVVQDAIDKPHKDAYEVALAAAPTIDDYSRTLFCGPDTGFRLYLYDDYQAQPPTMLMRGLSTEASEGDVVLNWETDLPDHIVGTLQETK